VRQAETAQPAYSEFLRQILEAEDGARWERKLRRRRRWSKLGPPSPSTASTGPPGLSSPPKVVRELLTCRFVEEHRNLMRVGTVAGGPEQRFVLAVETRP
jgi:hypothetical protein